MRSSSFTCCFCKGVKRGKQRLQVSQNMAPREIHCPKRNEVKGGCRKLHNEGLNNLNNFDHLTFEQAKETYAVKTALAYPNVTPLKLLLHLRVIAFDSHSSVVRDRIFLCRL
jgi:hypothetical protein